MFLLAICTRISTSHGSEGVPNFTTGSNFTCPIISIPIARLRSASSAPKIGGFFGFKWKQDLILSEDSGSIAFGCQSFPDFGMECGFSSELPLELTAQTWIVPTIIAVITAVVHLIVMKCFAQKLGADILEHCTADKLKETVCKAYENIGITTSLVMTTVVGLLIEGHEISPLDHPMVQINVSFWGLCSAFW